VINHNPLQEKERESQKWWPNASQFGQACLFLTTKWRNLAKPIYKKKPSNSGYKKLPKSGKFSPLPSYWRNFYHHAKFDLKSMNDRQWWPKWILYLKFSGFEALNFEVASGITYASSNMMRICFRVEKRLVILPSYLILTSTLLSGSVDTSGVVMITSI
jgi:hypothetical protein